jgi:geranylgeranyl reductase
VLCYIVFYLRKYLGLKSEFCFGFYYEIPKITNDFVWHVNPKELKSGYIWTFPHKNHTNIGVYFHPRQLSAKEAKNILEKTLTDNGLKFSTKKIKGSAINYCFKGYMFNKIFLVGDAAGLASKTTGEGISFALTSGKEIAKKIIESNYTTTELNKIVKIKKRQETLLNIYEIIPFLQNFLYKIYIKLMKNKWFQIYFGN